MAFADDPDRVYATVLNAEESMTAIIEALNAALGDGVGNAIRELMDRRVEKQMALHTGDTSAFGDDDRLTWEFTDADNARLSDQFVNRMVAKAKPQS